MLSAVEGRMSPLTLFGLQRRRPRMDSDPYTSSASDLTPEPWLASSSFCHLITRGHRWLASLNCRPLPQPRDCPQERSQQTIRPRLPG